MTVDAVAASAACDRCGTFSPDRKPLGSRQLCAACVTHVAQGARFWSSRYITGVGVLLNPTAAAVLLALNYQRLGEAAKARQMWINTVVLLLCYGALLATDVEIPSGVLLGVGIGLGLYLKRTFHESWERLRAAGAQSASRVLPVLFTLLVLAAFVTALVFLTPGEGLTE